MSDKPTIVVTGASGLVGTELVRQLEEAGWSVIRAVRRPVQNPDLELHWDPKRGEIDAERLTSADAVVHLAGENIAGKRWTESFKQKILHSRTQGTLLISETIARAERRPKVFVCASAIGYYGDRGDEPLSEEAAPGDNFLADVCRQWEAACEPAREAGVRVVNLRIGVVLSGEGGALQKMLTPFKLGAGGVLGDGKQYMSWITRDDLVGVIRFVVDHADVQGPVNAVTPNPVTNREFTKTLGKVIHRPTIVPMPAFAARLVMGEMADQLLLASARVEPTVLKRHGYQFAYPELEPALRHVV